MEPVSEERRPRLSTRSSALRLAHHYCAEVSALQVRASNLGAAVDAIRMLSLNNCRQLSWPYLAHVRRAHGCCLRRYVGACR